MDITKKIDALAEQIEELNAKIERISQIQNSQFTELMFELDYLKADKEILDTVLGNISINNDLYEDAKSEVIKVGKASTSFLQRRLGIGYQKASDFIQRLEDEAIIGEANGAKPREVLVKDNEELDQTVIVSGEVPDSDELYEEAKRLAIENGKVSTSYLQRKLKIGYARSAHLVDMLADQGVVEKDRGLRPRKVIAGK